MNRKNRYIRTASRLMMAKHYGTSVASMLMVLVLSVAFSTVQQALLSSGLSASRIYMASGLIAVLSLLMMAPAHLGAMSVFAAMSKEKPVKASEVFTWFGDGHRLWKSIRVVFIFLLVFALWAALFGVGAYFGATAISPHIFDGLKAGLTDESAWTALVKIYYLVLAVALLAALCALRYLPSLYLIAEEPERKIGECIKEGKKRIRGAKGQYYALQGGYLISLMGYAILASLVSSLFAGGDLGLAASSASWITLIMLYLNILPRFHLSNMLFLNWPETEKAE